MNHETYCTGGLICLGYSAIRESYCQGYYTYFWMCCLYFAHRIGMDVDLPTGKCGLLRKIFTWLTETKLHYFSLYCTKRTLHRENATVTFVVTVRWFCNVTPYTVQYARSRFGANKYDFSFSICCAEVEQITFTRYFQCKLPVLNFIKINISGIVMAVYAGELYVSLCTLGRRMAK